MPPVVVVDAVAGVEVQTEKVWTISEELELPRLIVLNRLDRERASLERSLASLREACGREVVPIQLPIGDEKSFSGLVDLVAMKAVSFAADGKRKRHLRERFPQRWRTRPTARGKC